MICSHPSMALSGVRSSCETVARNSSLRRLLSCDFSEQLVPLAVFFLNDAEHRVERVHEPPDLVAGPRLGARRVVAAGRNAIERRGELDDRRRQIALHVVREADRDENSAHERKEAHHRLLAHPVEEVRVVAADVDRAHTVVAGHRLFHRDGRGHRCLGRPGGGQTKVRALKTAEDAARLVVDAHHVDVGPDIAARR